MKLVLQHPDIRALDQLDRWVASALAGLLPLARIEEARIRLEYVPEASPPYRASAHLVVPGPDVRVEVVDHTARTAYASMMAVLRARVVERAARRLRRAFGDRLLRRPFSSTGSRAGALARR